MDTRPRERDRKGNRRDAKETGKGLDGDRRRWVEGDAKGLEKDVGEGRGATENEKSTRREENF